jgi:hypothetical protein
VKLFRWFATLLAFAIPTSSAFAQEPLPAGSPDLGEHDPADPLLSELLAWDQYAQASWQMIRNCDPAISRAQWRNMRLRYGRREQRILSVVRERFGERVIHGHDIIAIGRGCSRTTNGAFPDGIDGYRRALVAYERHLGIDPRTSLRN